MIKLLDVYEHPDRYAAEHVLYEHLAERTPAQSISHKEMPTWLQHCAFIARRPYAAWYLVQSCNIVGNIYLTERREVGIHIIGGVRGKGYGHEALGELRRLHPGPLLANINPTNEQSIAFFKRHGARLLQYTYTL